MSNDYYDQVRELWHEYAGVDIPDFDHTDLLDPDRALWQTQHGFNNTDYAGLTYRQVKNGQSRAGLTIDDLWPDLSNTDDAQQFIADMIESSARLTTQRNLRIDPSKPKWARVPNGKACAFCVMLASRGFVYTSEDTAGRQMQYHADCHCRIIPSWGRQTLDGYDPDTYMQMYQEGVKAAGKGNGYRSALAAMRRLHPEDLKDGVVPQPQIRWSHAVIRPTADELTRLSDFTVRMPWDQYTPEHKQKTLRGWTDGTFKETNGALYGRIPMSDDVRQRIDVIDEAISDHWTTHQFTVDRLMPLDTFELKSIEGVFDLQRNDVFGHAGYMATSLLEGGVLADKSLDRVATRILVPSGTNAVYLQPISKAAKRQEEVLLPRGTRLQVDGVGNTPDGPIVFIRLVDWTT